MYFCKVYLPAIFVGAAIVTAAVLKQPGWLGIAAPALALSHFVQREQLQELDLFHRMFADFNARYDRLHGRLQDFAHEDRHMHQADRSALLDYFNLCGEEYFYYSKGIVPHDVWQVWSRGILEYFKDDRVSALWQAEERTDTYYGLTREILEHHAVLGRTRPRRAIQDRKAA